MAIFSAKPSAKATVLNHRALCIALALGTLGKIIQIVILIKGIQGKYSTVTVAGCFGGQFCKTFC
jgi:hypothetical protein